MLEPLDGLPQKLRTGRQIPIGVAHTDMTQICRQHGQSLLDRLSRPIPAHQRVYGKAMAQVMNARTRTSGRLAQSDLSRESPEHSIHVLVEQPSALFGHEEIGTARRVEMRIALLA